MANPETVIEMAKELMRALEITMSPAAPQTMRQEAYNAFEHFKENSPYAAQVGLYLIQCEKLQGYIIHFGLQLMEHCIKFRWNHLSQHEKIFIKDNSMRLLMNGSQKETHTKDGLSRIIVEMIKREWPQQWPTLLAELNVASMQGASQAEVVLLILLRLCEDVALFQTIESSQRRKDLYQALTTNMADIFSFLLQLITIHVNSFKKENFPEAANSHYRVVQTGLSTLSGFAEWVNYTHFSSDNSAVLLLLCNLLEHEHFQVGAAECLLQIVSRKGPIEERKFLLEWFDLKALKFMLTAANNVSNKSFSENNYLFIKKLTQVFSGLGAHFCSLWGKEDFVSSTHSQYLDIYLNVMLTFSRHSSLTVISYANSVWSSFFKHQILSKDPTFQKYIPQWFETAAPKIIRMVYPTTRKPATDQDAAALFDFDSEEEFTGFFLKTRTELLDTFRRVTDIAPYVTYAYVDKWFRTVLQQSIQELSTNDKGFCSSSSPLYLQWDAMANLLDRVLNRLVHIESHARPSTASGLNLLELCLKFHPSDPLILSVLLSCISALFVFLSMASSEQSVSMLPRVLDKIFAASVFLLPGQTKENRCRAVKNVRRHAGALLVKIGQRYPLLLLPLFDQINATVQGITKNSQLSKMEQVTLQESLLLISNHFNDFNKQSQFIGEMMRSGTEIWFEMDPAFRTTENFMSFVGLDKPPVEPSAEDINGQNRSQIVFCTHLFFSILIRSTWPEDPDRAARGGFVVGRTSAGNPICRNPATPHIIPILPNVFALIRVLNALWTPQALSRLSQGYKTAQQMLELEKANLLSLVPPSNLHSDQNENGKIKVQSPLERMQQFLQSILENCYHILGSAGPSLGKDFYQVPELASAIITGVFVNLEVVPDYRIRPIVRTFLKNFISSCPKVHYEDVLLPVLGVFLPYMLMRLTNKWETLSQTKNEANDEEDNSDAQEILEEKLNSLITREYSDVIKICLVGGSSEDSTENEIMEQDDVTEANPPHRHANQVFGEAVSELGMLLLRNEHTRQVILLTLLRFLTWNDSSACLKAAGLLHSFVRHLLAEGCLNESTATNAYTAVLQALQIHGQHETVQGILLTLGVQLFDIFRPKYPCVLEILMQIPNLNQQDLHKFDEKIVNANQSVKNNFKVDKTAKDLFRKITQNLIGRSISQLFKKEVKIMDLPKMALPKKLGNENFNFDYGPELNRLLTSQP